MRSKRPQKKQSVLRRRSARGLGWTRDQGLVGLRVADREAGHEDDLRRVRRGFDERRALELRALEEESLDHDWRRRRDGSLGPAGDEVERVHGARSLARRELAERVEERERPNSVELKVSPAVTKSRESLGTGAWPEDVVEVKLGVKEGPVCGLLLPACDGRCLARLSEGTSLADVGRVASPSGCEIECRPWHRSLRGARARARVCPGPPSACTTTAARCRP